MLLAISCRHGCCLWSTQRPNDSKKKRIKKQNGVPIQGGPKNKENYKSFEDIIRSFTFPDHIVDLYIEATQEHFLNWKKKHPKSKLREPFNLNDMNWSRAKFLAYIAIILYAMIKFKDLKWIWLSYKPGQKDEFITTCFPNKSHLQSIHYHLHAIPQRLQNIEHEEKEIEEKERDGTQLNNEQNRYQEEWKIALDRLIPFKHIENCDWIPGEFLTLDDGVIQSKARMKAVSYDKSKPGGNRWGAKQDNLADGSTHRTGYVLDSLPRIENVEESERLRHEGKIASRILKILTPLLGSGRKFIGDSGYMSNLELHCLMYKENIGFLGTCNKKSKHLPAFNKLEKRIFVTNLEEGQAVRFYLVSRPEPITLTVFRDGSKRIYFYDNYLRLEPGFDHDLPYTKYRKNRKRYETLTQPLVRKLYNEFKGGVDTSNQLLSFTNYHFKNRRKYFSIFWGKLIQLGICNPFVLWRESQEKPKQVRFVKTLLKLVFSFQRAWLREAKVVKVRQHTSSFQNLPQPIGPHILINTGEQKPCAIFKCKRRTVFACDTCIVNGSSVHFCRDTECMNDWLPHQDTSIVTPAIGHAQKEIHMRSLPFCHRCKRRLKTVKECTVCPKQRLCKDCFNLIHHL